MDENVQKISKRTRRKKRSNEKRKNEPETHDFLSQESNNSTNIEEESPIPVKRVLRNRNITDQPENVAKKRNRRRKKKSFTEDTDNTESSISPVKTNKSPVGSSCISSADDSGSQNASRKYDSPLLRLRRSITNNSPKQDERGDEIEVNKDNVQDGKTMKQTRSKKKKKLKKQSVAEMNVSNVQHLINDTFDHVESDNKTPAKKDKSNEWTDATEYSFKQLDNATNPKRETYQLETSTLFPSPAKQRKKWDLSNATLNYSTDGGTPVMTTRNKSSFEAPHSTPQNLVRLSTRASTVKKTPFVAKKSLGKLAGSQIKRRDSLRKSTLKLRGDVAFKEEKIGRISSPKPEEVLDNTFNVGEDPAVGKRNKRRTYSLENVSKMNTRKSKVSFAVISQEIVDSSFKSDDEENFKRNDDNKRRTYSFDGIEKTPVVCKLECDQNKTDHSLLNDTLLQNTPKMGENESLTGSSFVAKTRHDASNIGSLDITSPPWPESPEIFSNVNNESVNRRVFLSKRLSKPKVSPTAKLSTTLKASKRISKRISGEKAILNLINDSTSTKKILGGRPSGTSTPRVLKSSAATSVIKSILEKSKKNITFNESVGSPSIAKIKRSKMPNFSLIHKKQFESMESISGYKERREERAKVLLSGTKVPSCYSSAKNSSALNNSTIVTCNKQLEFNKSQNGTLPKNKTPKKEVIAPIKEVITPIRNKTSLFKTTIAKVASPSKASVSNIPLINKNASMPSKGKVSQKTKLPVIRKTVQEKNVAEKPKVGVIKTADKSNCTKFGFKKTSKEELVALANKTRVPQANVTTRRNMIQGVRSNRRFELLMNMRKK